jgi:hypothetical protein
LPVESRKLEDFGGVGVGVLALAPTIEALDTTVCDLVIGRFDAHAPALDFFNLAIFFSLLVDISVKFLAVTFVE